MNGFKMSSKNNYKLSTLSTENNYKCNGSSCSCINFGQNGRTSYDQLQRQKYNQNTGLDYGRLMFKK